MAKRGKKYINATKGLEHRIYPLAEAIKLAKSTSFSKFPGSIELHLGINLPKDKDAKSVKSAVSLPHPITTGESRVAVFCEKEDVAKAKKAGAVEAGLEDLIKKIQTGWSEFDVILATAPTMPKIAILGKQLGPKGLMPNPKTGTLVADVAKGVAEFKKGKSKFACDETGAVHVVIGKADTLDSDIAENAVALVATVATTIGKPASTLLKSAFVAASMGAGIKVDPSSLIKENKEEEK